jgi:hypothetical protein
VSPPRVHDEHLPSLPRVPAVQVPLLHGYYGDVRLPAPLSPRFVAFAWRYHALLPVASLPAVQAARPRARGSSPGPQLPGSDAHGGRAGPPRFLGNPHVPMPCSPTPAGPTRQAFGRRRCCPRYVHNEGSHDNHSFEAPSHGLGTRCVRFVRSIARPSTQHSLPAAGQRCRAGLVTRRVPMKGFRVVSLHRFPLSQALPGARTSQVVFFVGPLVSLPLCCYRHCMWSESTAQWSDATYCPCRRRRLLLSRHEPGQRACPGLS